LQELPSAEAILERDFLTVPNASLPPGEASTFPSFRLPQNINRLQKYFSFFAVDFFCPIRVDNDRLTCAVQRRVSTCSA
jgi:hypothetical protein